MQEDHPSRFARKFLQWICPEELREEIEGDLVQRYYRDVKRMGERNARRRLEWSALKFFRPGILLRNKFTYQLINTMMLRNYVMIAFRNVAKNKVFSAINIVGLGIGLAACLLIFQFVTFELSYDKFHDKYERIYRVTNDRFQNGKLIQHGTITYPTIGPAMAKDYAEIEIYTRLMPSGDFNARVGDEYFRDDQSLMVDENFLSVFSFPLLAGERISALKDGHTVVITETLARKYFNLSKENIVDALGKEIYWGSDKQPYKVTGVCADIPSNSHIQFDALVSYRTLIGEGNTGADDSWTWSDFRHYIVLKPGANYKSLEAKFPAFSERYFKGDKVSGSVEKFYLQPLSRAHLYSDYEYDIARTASGKSVWAMLIIAIFILVIAWINYINLTTSRALDRAKEVGLRKVMGAMKRQLVSQFILESALVSCLAFVAAILFVQACQSTFNNVVGYPLNLWRVLSDMDSSGIAIFIGVMAGGIMLSGFYPAFVLSSYQPVKVLKGKFQRSSSGQYLRKALVIFQFTASAALITGTLIVSKQLRFMNTADLGMNITNVMVVQGPELMAWDSTFMERVENFKHALVNTTGIVSAATSSRLPGDRLGRGFEFRISDQPAESHYTLSFLGADYHFFDTYGISLNAGRRFVATDHKVDFKDISVAIINQHAVKLFGFASAEEAVGKELMDGNRKLTIIGVVNDFHQESLKKPMEPIVFLPTYSTYGPTSIRIADARKDELIPLIESIYKKFYPGNAFQYSFIEDRYNGQYKDEKRFARIISIFTGLGIIISCLGLVGLSSYTAVQRTKEIGIRKALGASLLNIITLLSSDFMKLVTVAIVLSVPVAYFSMDSWLSHYPYRIALHWFLFLIPMLLVFVIAAFTVSFQVLKTARVNPANTLKYE
jgi:putative ABC transport system permease protein